VNDLLLTSYFSKKKHPQYLDPDCYGVCDDGRVKQSDFSYIEKWYHSVDSLKLNAVIFYDNLTPEFIALHETDKIKFVEVESSKYTNNDWRFFCYRQYLEENPCETVFLSDCSDVVVIKDPRQLLNEYPDYNFFACKDIVKLSQYQYGAASFPKIIKAAGWAGKDFFEENGDKLDLINMGILGGKYEDMMDFLNLFVAMRSRYPDEIFNMNMALGQFLLRYALKDRPSLIGDPVTSIYKGHEDDRKDVFFIHK
tara:strand:+ start:278 stop:1036 length:759 start_codon:yes stop_codon:yes gene_type:complete